MAAVRRALAHASQLARIPYLKATVTPVLVGGAVAWSEGTFYPWLWLLTLFTALLLDAGKNLSNDYFDHVKGVDEAHYVLTPFSGGGRGIQDGIVTPRQMLLLAIATYLVVVAIGLWLAATRGWLLLAIGAIGILLAVTHNGPPFWLYYRATGLGQIAVALGFGPLMVLGTYYVQAQQLGWTAFWASLPVAALVASVLTINEYPDRKGDAQAGKKTPVVVWGTRRTVWLYGALLATAYVLMILGVVVGLMPVYTLIALLSVPLAVRCVHGAWENHDDVQRLIPTNALTGMNYLLNGLLLSVGFIASRLLGRF